MTVTEEQQELREALKLTGATLKKADLPFALAGGYAAWSHGAPEPHHDVDFVLLEDDVERAEAALREAGLRVVDPPEDWLFKVFLGDALVDVIFRICGVPVDPGLLERAQSRDVLSVHMPVLTPTDVLVTKLNALTEQTCDYSRLLPAARALREQVEWAQVEERTAGNDYAVGLLFLLRRLGVVPS